jgi:hypothetical protein
MSSFVITRYKICQACEHTLSAGHGCALRSGCCFGRWRTKPESQCPAGRWPAESPRVKQINTETEIDVAPEGAVTSNFVNPDEVTMAPVPVTPLPPMPAGQQTVHSAELGFHE